MKSTLILAAAALAALALANVLIVGSTGRGRAATSDGRTGSFDYAVSKRTASTGAVKFEGKLRFEQGANANGPYVLIEMGVPSVVGVSANGKVCEFSGKAVLVTTDAKNNRVKFGGTVSVRSADLRIAPIVTGDPDTFRIRFVGEKGLTYGFEGRLTSGDIVVSARTVK